MMAYQVVLIDGDKQLEQIKSNQKSLSTSAINQATQTLLANTQTGLANKQRNKEQTQIKGRHTGQFYFSYLSTDFKSCLQQVILILILPQSNSQIGETRSFLRYVNSQSISR